MKKALLFIAFLFAAFAVSAQKGMVIIVNDTVVASSNSIFPGGSGGASAWGQITGTLTNQTDLVTELAKYGLVGSNNTWTAVNNFSGDVNLSGATTISGPFAVNNIFTNTGAYAEVTKLYFGKTALPTGRRWGLEATAFGASITLESAEDSGIFGNLYTFNSTGTPANAEDVATKSYVDAQASSATLSDGDKGDFTVASGIATLDNGSVNSAKILDGSVATNDLATSVITEEKLNVTNSPTAGAYLTSTGGLNFEWLVGLPNNSVNAAQITNGTITEADLQISNNPVSGWVLGFDGTDGFQWVEQTGGSGGSFDIAADYSPTGAWDFLGSVRFGQGLIIDGPNGASDFSISQNASSDIEIGVDLTTRYTLDGGGAPTVSTDLTDKEYVDAAIAAVGSPNTNAGQKAFTTVDGSTTPTYTLAATDFAPGGADEGKLRFIIVQDTVEFTAPVITSTTKSLFVKGELNAKSTFKASGAQLFWIANEDRYVNTFEIDNMNSAAITPVSSTLYAVEGNVRGFNEDSSGPTAVGDFQESNIQTNSVRLTWTHATDDSGVAFYEISTDGTNYTNIGYLVQYDLLGLDPSTAYTVTIRGVDTSGNRGATASVSFTTSATFTLLTDGNSNTNIFSSGSGSTVANDTGLYSSATGDHLDPVNVQSQSAVATTVNGYTHANRVVSDGSAFSRVRPRFLNVTTQGNTYEWDFLYRMTDGGQYGAVNIDGTSVTGLTATDWTLVSGTSIAGGTTLDVEVYASNNAAANAGEAIEWILIVKEEEGQAATLDSSTNYSYVQFNDGTYPITNVYDNDTNTFAASFGNTDEKAVVLDLNVPKRVSYILLSTRSGFGTRLNDVNIQRSVDGTTWTTDSTTGTAFTGSGVESAQFDLVDQASYARYIRIQKPSDVSTVNLDLSEFTVYTFDDVDYQVLTSGNANPQIIDEGSAAFPPDEDNTTDYNGTNLHNTALRADITNQANTDLGTQYVTRVVSNASGTSQARLEFDNPNTGTEVFQYDFTYRMLQGTDGRLRIQGFGVDITGLAATEWTTISGEFTEPSSNLTVNVYSDNGAGSIGDTIEFKLSVKLKED